MLSRNDHGDCLGLLLYDVERSTVATPDGVYQATGTPAARAACRVVANDRLEAEGLQASSATNPRSSATALMRRRQGACLQSDSVTANGPRLVD